MDRKRKFDDLLFAKKFYDNEDVDDDNNKEVEKRLGNLFDSVNWNYLSQNERIQVGYLYEHYGFLCFREIKIFLKSLEPISLGNPDNLDSIWGIESKRLPMILKERRLHLLIGLFFYFLLTRSEIL